VTATEGFAAGGRSQAAGRRLRVVVGVVAAAVIVLDQATKRIAEVVLERGVEVAWLSDDVGWQLVYNDGGAFGFGAPSWMFLVVTVVVVVVVVRSLATLDSAATATAYGLLLAGALGNAIDRVVRRGDPGDPRFLHGHVIDFVAIDLPVFGPFPRFNVADVAITFGFALMVFVLWRHGEPSPATDGAPPRTP
jgi:signal peptidase II